MGYAYTLASNSHCPVAGSRATSCRDTYILPRLPNKLALTLWQTFDFFFLRWVKA